MHYPIVVATLTLLAVAAKFITGAPWQRAALHGSITVVAAVAGTAMADLAGIPWWIGLIAGVIIGDITARKVAPLPPPHQRT